MKNLNRLLFFVFLTLSFSNSYAQDGFSKFNRYEADSAMRGNFIDNLAYDSAANEVYFCLNTASFSVSPVLAWGVMTKIDIGENILQQRLDTITNTKNE